MTRRRYRYDEATGTMYEVGADAPVTPRVAVLGDSMYANLRATDGTPIDSRTKHRDYLRARGLVVADGDYLKHVEQSKEAAARERLADTKADVIESYRELRERRRR